VLKNLLLKTLKHGQTHLQVFLIYSDFSETFDYSSLTTGMYFISIKNGNKMATARIVKK